MPTPAIPGDIPLVGRVSELDQMVSRFAESERAAFVIAGAAGVGKTRLAAEVARAATGIGYATEHVVATRSAASIPFGAFATLLPDIDAPAEGLVGLLQHAAEAIAGRAVSGRGLLLVVDDAQLLDDGSAALVHQLVHARSCSVVASLRTPGKVPDPITALWKDGLAGRVDLDPLGERHIDQLTSSILGGPMAGASVRWLWKASAGNPLYVRELLLGAERTGTLDNDGGMWVLRLPLPAPDRLVELVASRLADLSARTVDVVELLAIGEPLAFGMLERISGPTALEDAERNGLIAVQDDGRRSEVRLSHPLYGEVVRQKMPHASLRRHCSTLARAFEATGVRRHDDLLRLARWQLDAGVHRDPVVLGRAAKAARQTFDMDLAARLARAALDSGGGVEAGLVLGEALFSTGRHAEAEAVLAGMVPLCGEDAERALIANARSYNLGMLMHDQVGAVRIAEEALSSISDPGQRLRLLGRLAIMRVYAGELSLAIADAAPLIDSDDEAMVHRGSYPTSLALALSGRTEEAVAVAYRGLETMRRSGDRTQLPESQLIPAVIGHLAGGRLALADADATTGYDTCLRAGDKDGTAAFALLRGWVYVEQGRLSSASRMFREGATINRELDDLSTLRWCLGGVALAEGMAGHEKPALMAMAELDHLPTHWMTAFDPDLVERARAWVKVASGEESSARALLERSAQRAAGGEQPVAEARLLHDLVRLGSPSQAAGRLVELEARVGGELIPAFAAHAQAVVDGSGSGLEVAALRFEALGAMLLAAEAASAASAAYRAEGRARQATACARRASELSEGPCEGVHIPGLAHGEIGRLTKREREVASLAALGASSKEIADRLFLSVRTVENHLQRAYGKLGVTSREELAALHRPL